VLCIIPLLCASFTIALFWYIIAFYVLLIPVLPSLPSPFTIMAHPLFPPGSVPSIVTPAWSPSRIAIFIVVLAVLRRILKQVFFFQHVGHGGWSGLLRRLTTRGLIQRFSIYPSSCQLVICQHFDVLLASVNVFNIRTFRSETVSQHTGVQVHSKVPFSLLGSQHAAVLHTPDCQDRRRARRPGVQISKPHAHRFGE